MSRYWHSEEGIDLLAGAMAPCRRVLDLACGFGNLSAALRRAGKDVYCLDISERSLKYAQERSGSSYAVRADIHALPFRDCFDGAVCLSSYDPHKIDTLCSQVRSSLRQGGLFAVMGIEDHRMPDLMAMLASNLRSELESGACPFSRDDLQRISSYGSLFSSQEPPRLGIGSPDLNERVPGETVGFRDAMKSAGFSVVCDKSLFEGTSYILVGQKI